MIRLKDLLYSMANEEIQIKFTGNLYKVLFVGWFDEIPKYLLNRKILHISPCNGKIEIFLEEINEDKA